MKKIYFFVASDTLAHLIAPIVEHIKNEASIKLWYPLFTKENADIALANILPNIQQAKFSFTELLFDRPDVIVFGNDWSPEAQIIIYMCRKLGITTFAIQESIVDFDDSVHRYQYVDYVFVQGEQTTKHLKRDNLIITGNPRYEKIKIEPIVNTKVLINSNFTYGIFEEERDKWIDDIVSICKQNNIKYLISQHPRDRGNLERYKKNLISSSASSVHQQLADCSLVVTRFSSLIHEAILMGRKVIYYNPHNEKMNYDFKPDNVTLFEAKTSNELGRYIEFVISNGYHDKDFRSYISEHILQEDELASKKIYKILIEDSFSSSGLKLQRINLIGILFNKLFSKLKKSFRMNNVK